LVSNLLYSVCTADGLLKSDFACRTELNIDDEAFMTRSTGVFSVGVEEEYQLVSPETCELRPDCKRVMKNLRVKPGADIQHELHLNQIEMASPVCTTLDEVRSSICDIRGLLIEAAARSGAMLASAGTNPLPLPDDPAMTPNRRYRVMTDRFQQLARDLLIFGCHVHVEMKDQDMGVQVMNRSRRWLPLLQALTANSPYWDGHDTGYASYRRELWAQWPMAGPPPPWDGVEDYKACIADLIKAEAIKDETFLYWDIRLPKKVPTIEYRTADAMSLAEETIAYVGLIRALVMQCVTNTYNQVELKPIRPSLLCFSMWHAARYGVTKSLIDPMQCETIPIQDMANIFLKFITPALEQSGDGDIVTKFVNDAITHGNGAVRQRIAAGDTLDLCAVVKEVAKETAV
jgi:glutamate---cysteine ligase / carboxylate-amine ligase